MSEENPSPPRKRKSGFDLRGIRVNTLKDSVQRKTEIIVVRPSNLSQANIANFWSFNFRARKTNGLD